MGPSAIVTEPFKLALDRYERRLLDEAEPPRHPPVFVLGVPRSGTTLLYQLLVHCLDVSYICNAANDRHRFALSLTRALRSRIRGRGSDFESDYGRTRSAIGPSEGRRIWHRWLPDDYVDQDYLSPFARDTMRRTVGALESIIGAPFVNKDPHHCVRVRALDAVFPECLFVHIVRDPVATAASLLSMRRRRAANGTADLGQWMSVKPKQYPSLASSDYVTQICGQVHYCAQNASEDLRWIAARRQLVVAYEELCARPRREVARIAAFLRARGVPAHWRRDPPASFRRPRPRRAPEVDLPALRAGLVALARQSQAPNSQASPV